MDRPRNRKRHLKAGVTLVEVMLAGAMTALVTLATLEGFVVATKIVHENAETLQADGIAFDLLWRKFYGDFEKMTSTTGKAPDWKNTSDSQSPYRSNVYTNAPSFTYSESISNCYGGKLLSIDLKYGTGNRFTRHLEVFRSEIPRTN